MFENIGPVSFALFVVFVIMLIIQLVYYVFVFSKMAFFKPKTGGATNKPVSVIICARNESKNLRKYLHQVLEQDYPSYQVIVVNDCSFDESGEYLKEVAAKYKHLKVVTIEEQEKYQHGKKFALTLGIKAADHDILLMTDADCAPASNQWLRNMQSHFVPGSEIVIAYGAFQKKPTMLNKMIRYDSFYNAIQYLSFSLGGNTYMGVGRNLAYSKELFFKNKGFANHYHLLSGDDDLLINEIATPTNTSVELNAESFTISEPKTTFKAWYTQKKRHISTSKHYKPKHKRLLGTLIFSHFLFYISFFALLIMGFNWQIVLSLYLLRLSIQMFIFGKGMKTLKEMDLLAYIPMLDLFIVLFYPVLGVSRLLYKEIKWK